MQTLIGQKKVQSQRFLENGRRIPVTLIDVKDNTVIAVLTNDKNNYQAVQLGFSMKKNATRAEIGHAKGAKLEKAPKFLREVKIVDESETLPEVGTVLVASEVFAPGDIVDVSGFSKGKGFAGGVKRYGFRGGPKTHGQSDRHRAPGAVGSGTTPGRVYKGKRMAGNMGNDNVTVRNLEVIDITDDGMLVIKGLVPGITNGLIVVKKVGEDKKYIPLYRSPEEIEAAKAAEPSAASASEAETISEEAETQAPAEEKAEVSEAEETTSEEKTEEVKAEEAGTEEAASTTEVKEEVSEPESSSEEIKEEVKEEEENAK